MTVAVIGAGPAGSAAAHALKLHGEEVILLERQEAIGGRSRCYRKDGFTMDTGAGFVTNFYPRLFSLAADLGFTSKLYEMNRISGLYRDGKIANLDVSSPVSFIKFPFLTAIEKCKIGYWMAGLTLKRKKYDLAVPETLVDIDTQSIASYARKTLTENIYHTIIRPGIEPFWYFSCEDASEGLMLALSAQAAGAKFYSFPDGIDTICNQLTEKIDVRCNTEVQRIEERENGYRLHLSENDQQQTLDVDKVIIATTASVAHKITADLSEQSVSTFQREFLSSQQYAANIHATVCIPTLTDIPKAGSIFPCGKEKNRLAALSFHRVKKPSHDESNELVSIYLSDTASLDMMPLSDEEVYEQCWKLGREVCDVLPEEYKPFHLIRRKEAIPLHAVGRYKMAAEFNKEQKTRSLQFCGDYLATATIEGAIATGWQTSFDINTAN
jgi:protoporphyrinogen/coproporphyrinogen III oxidase